MIQDLVPRDTPQVALNVFADKVRQIIRRVRDAGGQVLLLTPNPMTGKHPYASQGYYKEHDVNSALDSYAASIRSVALETHTDLVDVYAAWIHIPGYERFLPDGVHPNPEGHRRIAELILPRLLKQMQSQVSHLH